MTPDFRQIMTLTGLALDVVGVLIVAVEALLSVARFLLRLKAEFSQSYRLLRVVTTRTVIGPNLGAFAAFTDPVGNEFGLYEEPQR